MSIKEHLMRCPLTTASATENLSRSTPEFVIYFFEKDEHSKGSPVWQEYKRLQDEREALRRADALFMSSKFTRVEVRRKSVNEKGQIIDKAVKVLDATPHKQVAWKMFFTAAGICACAAFIIAFHSL